MDTKTVFQRSRRQRRAQEALHRRQHNKAVQHSCVLHRDCVEYGVAIEVDPREYHPLHIARGEPTCPACPICQERERLGKPPAKMNAGTRAAFLAAWTAKLEWHSMAFGVAALLAYCGGFAQVQGRTQ